MKRTWTFVAVADVPKSAEWYGRLLNAHNTHDGSTVFDQIIDAEGEVLLCLHWWGPSGPGGDHHWHPLARRDEHAGNGFLLWFIVDDFEAAWQRAQDLCATIVEAPNSDNGTFMPAFVIQDLDGYYVVVNKARQ
jgi:Glyoxalase/Bleomycin resistance protein/Dioxygenase superfamily